MIRRAVADDIPHLARCIRELARYERLEHECEIDEARLRLHLFGPQSVCAALLAAEADRAVGFALFYVTYSTFKTRPCLHLEDLFVMVEARGKGHGLALLRAVAAETLVRGCARLDWHVLDWNAPAI
ncbi:MAG TPA: GNAT family N-acetyltransferase, partial [Planctomycetota bacterium]|nr:GNAT family N-acetyltransferase [Planctomycetota bacterium]